MAPAPSTGRFISRDPVAGYTASPQSLNGYAYAMSNPVMRSDPTGMSPQPAMYVTPQGEYTGDFNRYASEFRRSRDGVDGAGKGRVQASECSRQTGGGAVIDGEPNDDRYVVRLPGPSPQVQFTVLRNHPTMWEAIAQVWDWMVIWVAPGIQFDFDSDLYHHEVGHILQQRSYGDLTRYRVVAAVFYAAARDHRNWFEQAANCYAGLPRHWGNS